MHNRTSMLAALAVSLGFGAPDASRPPAPEEGFRAHTGRRRDGRHTRQRLNPARERKRREMQKESRRRNRRK